MKTKLFLSSFIFFLICSTAPRTFAQWQTKGPYGGPIMAMNTMGSNVCAGTGNGIFSSTNAGMNWSMSNTGIERRSVVSIITSGTNMFAGTSQNGVFISTNSGVSWTAKNNGITNMYIASLFSQGTNLFAGSGDGVFYSSNNGNSWTLANNGIPTTYAAYCFANMTDTIYAGTYGMGLYRSHNNGASWTVVTAGFPAGSFVYSLMTVDNTIYAGTDQGVFKSMDRGKTWILSNMGFTTNALVKCFADGPSVVSGATLATAYLFAGTYSEGIFVSMDNGNTWNPANNGIPDLPFPTGLPHNYPSVNAITTAGSNVLAGTADGLYLSQDNGNSWSEYDNGILGVDLLGLTNNSTTVFAGTGLNGVFTSADMGATWKRSNNGLTSYNVLAIDAKNTVFVSTLLKSAFRSDDNGGTWVSASSGLTSDPAFLESDNTRELAITSGAMYTPRGLFQTKNNGSTWTEIPITHDGDMSALFSTATSIYVGTTNGKLYMTNNDGANWQDISASLPNEEISSILLNGNSLFVGTKGHGIYNSMNNGTSWATMNTGLTNDTITDLFMQANVMYASTWGAGVFRSVDMGVTWSPLNTGLSSMYARNLSSDGQQLYVSTEHAVFEMLIATGIANVYSLDNIELYPNPVTGKVYFTLPVSQKVSVSVNSIDGALVYQRAGYMEEKQSIDLADQTPGIYFVNIQTETSVIRKKIIVQ